MEPPPPPRDAVAVRLRLGAAAAGSPSPPPAGLGTWSRSSSSPGRIVQNLRAFNQQCNMPVHSELQSVTVQAFQRQLLFSRSHDPNGYVQLAVALRLALPPPLPLLLLLLLLLVELVTPLGNRQR